MCKYCKALGFNMITSHLTCKTDYEQICQSTLPYHPVCLTNTANEECWIIFRNNQLITSAINGDSSKFDLIHDVFIDKFDIDYVNNKLQTSSMIEHDLIKKFSDFTNMTTRDINLSHCNRCIYAPSDEINCCCIDESYVCCSIVDCNVHNVMYQVEVCSECSMYLPECYAYDRCYNCTIVCCSCDEPIDGSGFCPDCYSFDCNDDVRYCEECTICCFDCNSILTNNELNFCQKCMTYECSIVHEEGIYLCSLCTFDPTHHEVVFDNEILPYNVMTQEGDDTIHIYVLSANHEPYFRTLALHGEFYEDNFTDVCLYTYTDDMWNKLPVSMQIMVMYGC